MMKSVSDKRGGWPDWMNPYRRVCALLLFFCFIVPCTIVAAANDDEAHQSIIQTVRHLSSLGGRETGTEEGRAARDIIASRFKEMGLKTVSNSSFQPFDIKLRNLEAASLTIDGKAVPTDDFVPLLFSASGEAVGETVFVGYGIEPADYNGIRARGRIVVALAGTPPGIPAGKAHETLVRKVHAAREHGARALILLDEKPFQNSYTLWPERVPPVLYDRWKKKAGDELPVQIDLKVAQHESMLPMPDGEVNFPCVTVNRDVFDSTKKHRLTIKVKARHRTLSGANVVGLLQGTLKDTGKNGELLIIGAHYDHLGKDSQGRPYPGADDNASGVAALLGAAKRLIGIRETLKRDILFIAFDGEEWGLHGSTWYVNHPLFPLDKTVAMLNVDTVGRNRPDEIYMVGARQDPELFPLAVEAGVEAGLSVSNKLDFAFPYGSDHYPFHRKGVPAVDFSSSLHDDYHTIGDSADKVDAAKTARVTDLLTRLAVRIAGGDIRFSRPLDVVVPYPRRE